VKTVKKLLVILGVLLSTSVFAEQGDVWVKIGGPGQHLQNNSNKNNMILGVNLNYEVIDRLSLGVEVYRNSYQDKPQWINGVYKTPELISEAVVVDYRLWTNDMWALNTGWRFANHYGSSNGLVFRNIKDMPYAAVCRKIGDSESNWQGCVQATFWRNQKDNSINESLTLKLQYTFGK
jgi:hypothetical protein